ncbi:hypothetical protein [Mycobacteroides abscessus]|uniref:hypothetical protein n=1 Tax=Mycobacteroides abscessus TaxID=36809 RepID=UPI0005DFE220|nr:hypothetical protein [Mycobacteroides abscessus]CPR79072.1 Uncharacterised protein [Mycobacteroides abscessus]CPR88238.1 Uncharacterised protein [Mycobacteroides abscessus]CPS43206.1 Uncharacterised protein [Mycobacteroides abscessus]CPV02988.1 Uncharacterised protein [Mycobacteroides abscessus]
MAEIDTSRSDVIRAVEGSATASYYPDAQQVVVVANDGAFADAEAVLTALQEAVAQL